MNIDLNARLKGLMLTRAIIATLLGAGLIALQGWVNAPELWGAWLSAIGPALLVSYALNALSWPLVERALLPLPLIGYTHLIIDVFTGALIIWHTGRLDSPLVLILVIVVLFGATLFERTGAWVSATLGVGAFVVIALLDASQIDLSRLDNVSETLRLLLLNTLIQVALLCVVATLASHLSERFKTAHLRLQIADQDLRTLRKLNERLLTRSQTGVVHLNAEGRVLFANRAASALLGFEVSELLNLKLFERLPWLSPPSEPLKDELGQVSSRYWESAREADEGRGELIVACALSELSDLAFHRGTKRSTSELEGSALLIQDITLTQRQREEQQRRVRLASLGAVAAQLAHELRNPLASMRSSLQLLERQLSAPHAQTPLSAHLTAGPLTLTEAQLKTQRRLLSILDRETGRLSQLTRSFLEVARPPSPQPELTPLLPTLQRLVELHSQPSAPLMLRNATHELQGVCVWVDPYQLEQILLNLIKNAQEAMEGAQRAHDDLELKVELSVELKGELVSVSVLDRGDGLPHDVEALFTPFFTSKVKGSGLGLALSRALADANNGALTASPRDGGGARFTLTLPQSPSETLSAPESDTLLQAITDELYPR